jgi:peptide/nickel transport system permease protein
MRMLKHLGRMLILLILVAAGTLGLVRYTPGYFADIREMDAMHAGVARADIDARRVAEGSSAAIARSIAVSWLHGQLGVSRQYQVPVSELIRPRILVTAHLLGTALAMAWLSSFLLALLLSAQLGRSCEAWVVAGPALLLSVPIGALATIFILSNAGGPSLAVGLLLGARDFKFLYRLLRRQWQQPYLLFAVTQGLPLRTIVLAHLLRPLWRQLASLATMSFVAALSMAVPAEVLFDVPGIGQLAWSAAMNRDLPLLLAITLLMAAAVGAAGLLTEPWELSHEGVETA